MEGGRLLRLQRRVLQAHFWCARQNLGRAQVHTLRGSFFFFKAFDCYAELEQYTVVYHLALNARMN